MSSLSKTKIPYATHHWSFCVGCPPPMISEGCRHCWSRRLHDQRHRAYLAGKQMPPQYAKPFSEIQVITERRFPRLPRKASIIFVLPQSDLFHDQLSLGWATAVYDVAAHHPKHTFLLLTKRPQRAAEWWTRTFWPSAALSNLWLGVTVTSQSEAGKVDELINHWPGNIWVSAEPLLGSLGFTKEQLARIGWVIVGGESAGQQARPMSPCWVHELDKTCCRAGVPLYFKQRGSRKLTPWSAYYTWGFELRKQFPQSFPLEAVERLGGTRV